MKVILKENIEDLGKKGDIIRVAPGYGRNYLIPKKIALEVTPTNTKMIEMVQKALRKGLVKEMASYQSLIDRLNGTTLTFERKAGEKDAIFGSVSGTDIRDALTALGMDIEKKKILLDEPIKRLGNFTVSIKVFHDERAEIKLEVNKEGAVLEEVKVEEEKAEEIKEEPTVDTEEPKQEIKPEPEEEPSDEAKPDTEIRPAEEKTPESVLTEEAPESEKGAEPEEQDKTDVPKEVTPKAEPEVETTEQPDGSETQDKKDE